LEKAIDKAYAAQYAATQKTLSEMEKDGERTIDYWTKIYQTQLDAKIEALETIEDILAKNRDKMQKYEEDILDDTARNVKLQSDIYNDELDKRIKKNKDALDKITKDDKESFEDIKRSAGHIFDSMFEKGQNVFASLKNALKGGALSLGRSIFEDVTAQLLGPIKKAFDDFFTSLINSAGIKKFITDIGAKLGGMLAGIFGGGGGSAAGAAGGAGAGAGAGAGFGISGASLGAFFTNPATIAVGAAIAAATVWLKSQAHWEANKFVQNIQNPFGDALGEISDAFAAAEASGDLTIDAARAAKKEVEALWKKFQDDAKAFAKGGSDEAKVVRQAFEQLEPFMEQIFGDMDKSIAKLAESTDETVTSQEEVEEQATASAESVRDLSEAAREAIDPISALAGAIADLASAAASAGAGGGSGSNSGNGVSSSGSTGNGQGTSPFGGGSGLSGGFTPGNSQSGIQQIFGNQTPENALRNSLLNIFGGTPSYATGTNYVPNDGLAYLHQGEAVVPARKNRGGINILVGDIHVSGANGRQVADEISTELVKKIADKLNREVERGALRLTAKGVNR
jgi:hypothetical protein